MASAGLEGPDCWIGFRPGWTVRKPVRRKVDVSLRFLVVSLTGALVMHLDFRPASALLKLHEKEM